MEMLEEHRCFEGWQQRWRHDSSTVITPRHQCCTGFPD